MFRDAYARRRCIVPVDGFFEWKAIKGQKARQPFAIAMKDGSPFGIAGLWENWKEPISGQWMRTFTIVTVPANQIVGAIHDRMPAILHREDYDRWLGPEPDPDDVLRPFPSELLRIWPISTRVNSPNNDDEHLLDVLVTDDNDDIRNAIAAMLLDPGYRVSTAADGHSVHLLVLCALAI